MKQGPRRETRLEMVMDSLFFLGGVFDNVGVREIPCRNANVLNEKGKE